MTSLLDLLKTAEDVPSALDVLMRLRQHSRDFISFDAPFSPQSKNHRVPTKSKKVRVPEHVEEAQRKFSNLCVLNRPDSCPWRGPVFVELLCVLPLSKTKKREQEKTQLIVFHTGVPDVDNLAKLPLDAMTKADIWLDDAQVVGLLIVKVYGSNPRTTVRAWEILDVAVEEEALQ